jgi:hypothetical protein
MFLYSSIVGFKSQVKLSLNTLDFKLVLWLIINQEVQPKYYQQIKLNKIAHRFYSYNLSTRSCTYIFVYVDEVPNSNSQTVTNIDSLTTRFLFIKIWVYK